MKQTLILAAALAAVGAAQADYSGADDNLANRTPFVGTLSRADVQQDLADATQSGDLIGMHGVPFNRIASAAYPAKPSVEGKTRAVVEAELAMALWTGEMLADNETGMTRNELNPARYAEARASTPSLHMAGDPREVVAGERTSAAAE